MKSIMAIGDILEDTKSNKLYRVVFISDANTILCEMNISAFKLSLHDTKSLILLISSQEIKKKTGEEGIVFDETLLSQNIRDRYLEKKRIIADVMSKYGQNLMLLYGRTTKPELYEILSKYSLSKASFWKMLAKYMQSGMKDYSLLDARVLGVNKGKEYKRELKSGSKSEYINIGIVVTEQIKKFFDEALDGYRSGRHRTLASCYDEMNGLHFSRIEILDGVQSVVPLPPSERPTMRQFYYYASRKLTPQEKDAIKTSKQEQRNNKRLIISDALYDVYGPGDMVEIDACEADVSLVSSINPNKTVGRPTVYFMIDVYTRIILAMSIAFDNNSILGLTNLFLNLVDDKHEYCSKFGIEFSNTDIWPSNIIPRRVRIDRAAEFKGSEFDRICNELCIERQLLPGASGSLKGVVEQSFHQMHSKQNSHLEGHGLIEARYDSNHHKTAVLNIEQYTKMVINFVLTHNQEYDSTYPLTREMIELGIKPIPVLLWEYGVKKYGNPRPITEKNQYLFSLMTPVKAKIDRRGIKYKELYYFSEQDEILSRDMFRAGSKKIAFAARMDMRDISNIYYLRDGKLMLARLNERLASNAGFSGMTMKQYEEYMKRKHQMDAEGRIHNQELSVLNYVINSSIVKDAKKSTLSDEKNIRTARAIEKQKVSHNNRIITRIDDTQRAISVEESEQSKELSQMHSNDYENFDEALEDFWEKY